MDIIAVDPFRNIYQSGLSEGDINEDLLAFFIQRLETLLDRINPKAGMIIAHHTNKITGKMLTEDPMSAISGGGAILSYHRRPDHIIPIGETTWLNRLCPIRARK